MAAQRVPVGIRVERANRVASRQNLCGSTPQLRTDERCGRHDGTGGTQTAARATNTRSSGSMQARRTVRRPWYPPMRLAAAVKQHYGLCRQPTRVRENQAHESRAAAGSRTKPAKAIRARCAPAHLGANWPALQHRALGSAVRALHRERARPRFPASWRSP